MEQNRKTYRAARARIAALAIFASFFTTGCTAQDAAAIMGAVGGLLGPAGNFLGKIGSAAAAAKPAPPKGGSAATPLGQSSPADLQDARMEGMLDGISATWPETGATAQAAADGLDVANDQSGAPGWLVPGAENSDLFSDTGSGAPAGATNWLVPGAENADLFSDSGAPAGATNWLEPGAANSDLFL